MTRTDAIIAAVTFEIAKRRNEIEAATDLNSLMIIVRTTTHGQPKKTTVSVQTESEAPSLSALAALIAGGS